MNHSHKSPETSIQRPEQQVDLHEAFDVYQDAISARSGFLKFGLDFESFTKAMNNRSAIIDSIEGSPIPLAINNDEFELIQSDESIYLSVMPGVGPETFEDGSKIISQRQIRLGEEAKNRILAGGYASCKDILSDITLPADEELFGDGYAEFVILTKYDTSSCPSRFEQPPNHLFTKDGHVVTTDRSVIKENINGLIELHEAVFSQQAAQIGYYGGMDAEAIQAILDDDSFVPVVVLDKDTQEPITFALFTHKLKGYDKISWANQTAIEAEMSEQGGSEFVSVPLVITAKVAGIGSFREIVRLAAMQGMYDTKATSYHLLYESNSWSVLVTPRTLDANLQKVGFEPIESAIEVTVLTQKSQPSPEKSETL